MGPLETTKALAQLRLRTALKSGRPKSISTSTEDAALGRLQVCNVEMGEKFARAKRSLQLTCVKPLDRALAPHYQ